MKNEERKLKIQQLYARIDQIYSDEKIKKEKLEEYTQGLVKQLKLTTKIEAFSKVLAGFMPKYNELKHFNAGKIACAYEEAILKQQQVAEEAARKGPLNLTFNF